jgi:hypothetical protein
MSGRLRKSSDSFRIEVSMFGSLGYSELAFKLALVLAPVYLVYRVVHHYRYTKALEKALNEKAAKSN